MKTKQPIRRLSKTRWTDIIDALDRSNLSLADFARREGLAAKRLYYWRQRLARQVQPNKQGAKPVFAEVMHDLADPDQPQAGFHIELRDGVKLHFARMPTVAYLSQLLGAL